MYIANVEKTMVTLAKKHPKGSRKTQAKQNHFHKMARLYIMAYNGRKHP